MPASHNADENNETAGKKRGKLKRAAARVAPGLARALGGPLAGAAVEAIARAVLGGDAGDEDALAEALAVASPEQLVALKKAEQEFQVALRQASVEELRIDAADRASARARQVEMNDWTPSALGALVILGFFVVLGVMVTKNLPPGAETEFSIMLGALATMTAAVVNYFFGSSAGSREKTRLIAFPAGEADARKGE
ncbi:MAG: hypothetical protein R3C58_06570 [Parvularculaceae bacterium]